MRRPSDKHIDSQELDALVPSSLESGGELHGLSLEAVRDAEHHVRSCVDCAEKVSKYRQLLRPVSTGAISNPAPAGPDCPNIENIEWYEVAAGLWPELRAKQLIIHAALCDHCGPLLRAAASVYNDPTPQEQELLAELKAPSRPDSMTPALRTPRSPWQLMRWLVPAVALILVVGVVATRPRSSTTPLSGPKYAEVALLTYKQQAQGGLVLDIRSDSQQEVNEWFKRKLPFSVTLPASPVARGEKRPYRLEGARLVQVGTKAATYLAYSMQTGPVGLMVAPDSVAVASGGVVADFKKVSFHYGMIEGYKVVTWSQHGLTYALVSHEGVSTQQSCMVCHSAMRDRDLSRTPTPLHPQRNAVDFFSN